jgi:hypothetical protein
VFEELSGGFGGRSAEDRLRLANGGDLVYAGYNDAIGYGELVRGDGGRLVRHFLQDDQDPAGVNVGAVPEEAEGRFAGWIDLAAWRMRMRNSSRAVSRAGFGFTELPDLHVQLTDVGGHDSDDAQRSVRH